MATRKGEIIREDIGQEEAAQETPVMFSKEQILGTRRYAQRRDLVNALLVDGKSYKFETVDEMIENFMKGKVK